VLVWVLWALGAGGLVICALLLSGVVALVRKASASKPAPQPAPLSTRA
jgi:hypothetical protein